MPTQTPVPDEAVAAQAEVAKDTASIDEVAQAIANNLQDQQDANKPELTENPVVPCVHKPDPDKSETPPPPEKKDQVLAAAIGLTSLASPSDSPADDGDEEDNKKVKVEETDTVDAPPSLDPKEGEAPPIPDLNPKNEGDGDDVMLASADTQKKTPTADGIASAPPGRSFPELLYEIISDPATDDICSWLPHGKGFVIQDKNRFGKEILPVYFDGTKFTSFTRRLKRWSFTRIARGAELGAYYNENFVRDCPAKVLNMRYRVVHGDVVGAAAATMASGGSTHAAAAAALAAAAMIEGKRKIGKTGKNKKEKEKENLADSEMSDGMFPPSAMCGMMDPRVFPMPQWNNPYNMIPMNMMQQQYYNMMAQSFAAQQGAFNNFAMNMNMQNSSNMPQQHFPGDTNNNFPMMMNMNMSQNPQNISQPQFQGSDVNMQQFPNQQHNLTPQQLPPINPSSIQPAKQEGLTEEASGA
eukprot:CCRYP_003942-RA/>CCRYP_003942-RA protein AED:0.12 eAED:0.12 QI:140/1/1/1/0/0.33/3/674/468